MKTSYFRDNNADERYTWDDEIKVINEVGNECKDHMENSGGCKKVSNFELFEGIAHEQTIIIQI